MHEYEFRLVVQDSSSFIPLIRRLGYPLHKQTVYYVKPHFRFRNRQWEMKRKEITEAVYHDGLWFRWVHSIETAYSDWTRSTCLSFLHAVGDFQDPFTVEYRDFVTIDAQAQMYTYQNGKDSYRLVFEWEYGVFDKPLTSLDPDLLLGSLSKYKCIYDPMKIYPSPPYPSQEKMTRRPVTCIDEIPRGSQYLYAHKLDGTFGLVYSYGNRVKEKWEGYECVIRENVTLADGCVFAAERLEGGEVVLLDVYQVRGCDTASWCRRGILTEFLPSLKLIEGYFVQTYVSDMTSPTPAFKTDGLIIHDVVEDRIFKYKTSHSVDLVYFKGYFYLPNGRIRCLEKGLEERCVYEIATTDGRVIRKRADRFKGNTVAQLEKVMKHGWHGPAIEPLPEKKRKRSVRK